MFLIFVVFTLGITYWASKRVRSRSDFYLHTALAAISPGSRTARRLPATIYVRRVISRHFRSQCLPPVMTGDLFAGLPCRLANYPVLIAERLRNLGRYTFADVASYRLKGVIRIHNNFRPVKPR